jgi:hypothetical protein
MVYTNVFEAAGVAWWSSALTPTWEGARSIPNTGTPFPTLGIGCFTPLPGSGWQVLFDSKNMARLVPKNRRPCKNKWRDSQNPIHKKKKKKITNVFIPLCIPDFSAFCSFVRYVYVPF